jgi:hypothetical protein
MSDARSARIAPLLALLAEALEAGTDSSWAGNPAALVALGQLARLHIPVRGVLPLTDDQLFNAIDVVGAKHFDLAAVRTAVDSALRQVEPFSSRDEIEVAVDHLCAVLNVTYFHAGLAFGITFSDLR